jgi:hypothetical protein
MTALLPPGVKVHLALGYIDMRTGLDGLAMLVQGVLQQDPFTGHLFVFRGRTRANLIKIIFWDGPGSVSSPNGSSMGSFCGHVWSGGERRRRNDRSPREWRAPPCWPMFWSENTAIIPTRSRLSWRAA